MNNLFWGCNNLEKIVWPNDEKYSLVESISYMFGNCIKLTSINLSNFNLSKIKKMDRLFYSCNNLEKIVWPNDKKSSSVESISYMFYDCRKLISVISLFLFLKIFCHSIIYFQAA